MSLLASSSPTAQADGRSCWRPPRSSAGDSALWVSLALALAALVLLGLALRQEPAPGMLGTIVPAVLLALVAAGLALWATSYRQLGYLLGAEALEIPWMGRLAIIPYTAIDGIYTGQRLVGNASPSVPSWPGIYVGPGRLKGFGRLRFFCTSRDPANLTVVSAGQTSVVLSTSNPRAFRAALIERIQATEDLPVAAPESRPRRSVPWSTLTDRWAAWTLAAALLLVLLLLAVLLARFASLPEYVPLHFDATGQPNQIGSRNDLFRLATGGSFILFVNWLIGVGLHPASPHLARVLWTSAAVAQAVLVIAMIRLLQ